MAQKYNLRDVILMVDAYRVTGFAEDSIEVEPASDEVEDTAGADGEVAISVINDDRMTMTINVMEQSEAARILGTIYARQRLTSEGFVVSMNDPQNGDKLSSEDCFMKSIPGLSKARTINTHTYQIIMPHAKRQPTFGIATLAGLV